MPERCANSNHDRHDLWIGGLDLNEKQKIFTKDKPAVSNSINDASHGLNQKV